MKTPLPLLTYIFLAIALLYFNTSFLAGLQVCPITSSLNLGLQSVTIQTESGILPRAQLPFQMVVGLLQVLCRIYQSHVLSTNSHLTMSFTSEKTVNCKQCPQAAVYSLHFSLNSVLKQYINISQNNFHCTILLGNNLSYGALVWICYF